MTNPDELERMARAATPGPWMHTPGYYNDSGGQYDQIDSPVEIISGEWGGPSGDNAAFIAAANPATILALLSANRDMRTATPDLTAVIAWLKNGCDPAHAVTELQIYQDRIARSALTTQRGDGE